MNRHFFQPSTVLVLSFLAAISIGTLLLMLPLAQADGVGASFVTALFTATSAVCVTGLVVVDTGTYWSGFGQSVILVLFQLGGFGMMTSATLLGLVVNRQMRLRSRLLLQAETRSLGLGDVKSIAWLILIITVVVELAATLVLTLRLGLGHDMPWGQALWHGFFQAVSAYNNAGFSTWSNSVMGFAGDAWVLVPIMLAVIIGGVGFPVLHELMVERDRRHPSMHTVLTLWGSGALMIIGAVVIYLAEKGNPNTLGPLGWADQALVALFTSVSTRSSGFNAVDIGQLSSESMVLHYALMLIGGGSAGTAGGVKVTTFFILLLVVWNEIRGNQDVEFRNRRIATSVQRQALTILVLSVAMIVLAMLVILPMTHLPLDKVLFEVISAFSTVGLSTGITAELPPAGQLLLVLLMFTGRVGVVTLAAAIAMNHMRRDFRYPEEKPIVG